MNRRAVLVLAVVLTTVFCALNGCGNKSDTDAELKIDSDAGSMTIKAKDGGDDVEIKMGGGGMTVTSKDGEVVATQSADGETFTMTTGDGGASMAIGKGAKLPDGFPKDIPIYAGAEIQMTSADPASSSFSVQAMSSDAIDKVAEYYKKEMKSQGWTESQGMVQTGDNPMHMLNFEKGESNAVIVVTSQDGKTSLSITTGTN